MIENFMNQLDLGFLTQIVFAICLLILSYIVIKIIIEAIFSISKNSKFITFLKERRFVLYLFLWFLFVVLILNVLVKADEINIILFNVIIILSILVFSIHYTKNIFSAIILFMNKQIKENKYIRIGNITGTIKRIGLRSVELETRDGNHVFIPNHKVLEENIFSINEFSEDTFIELRFLLKTDDIKKMRPRIRESIIVSPYLNFKKSVNVFMEENSEESEKALFKINAYAINKDFTNHLKSDILVRINQLRSK
jgi:small-conductance mechanosensitive channel